MSETENGAMAMVSPDEIIPTATGVGAYSRVFKFLEVVALPQGERILRVRQGGTEIQFRIDAKGCAHLVDLLRPEVAELPNPRKA